MEEIEWYLKTISDFFTFVVKSALQSEKWQKTDDIPL